jgi:serine/threonine protein kinase
MIKHKNIAFNYFNSASYMLLNKYKIISNISNGEFGQVTKATYNDKHYAIKCGAKDLIKYEIQIYKQLRSISNISTIYELFETNNKMYMVMDLYTMTLEDYKLQNCEHLNYVTTTLTMLGQLIAIIKLIHENNIIHRDLKPTNICLDTSYNLYIIDFGLSKMYKINNIHNSETQIKSLIGSVNFSSLNVINLIEPSRRDDIESLLYILFYLLLDKSCYSIYTNLDVSNKKNIDILLIFLQDKNNSILNNKSINYTTLDKLFKYIRRLKYNQVPNYDYIIILLNEIMHLRLA